MSVKISGKDFQQIYNEVEKWIKNDWTGGWTADFYNSLEGCGIKKHPVTEEPIFIENGLYETNLDYTILSNKSNIEKYEMNDKNSDWWKSFYKVINLIEKAAAKNKSKAFSEKKLNQMYEREFEKIADDLEKLKPVEMNITKEEEKYLFKQPKDADWKKSIIELKLDQEMSDTERKIKIAFLEKIINSKSIDGVIGQFFKNMYDRYESFRGNKELKYVKSSEIVKNTSSIYQKIVDVLNNHPEQCLTPISKTLKEYVLNPESTSARKIPYYLNWISFGITDFGMMKLFAEVHKIENKKDKENKK